MRVLRFDGLYDGTRWVEPAFVPVDADGKVAGAITEAAPAGATPETIGGFAVAGFQNAHSHAFQYAMAGLAEHLPAGAASDDFWSWREAMYKLAQKISPEQLQAVAAMVYAEMARRGITAVAEFHYLHHAEGGKPFAELGEMSGRLIAAAETAGLHLTLLPTFYQKGGFNEPPRPTQQRFICKTVDEYARLHESCKKLAAGKRDVLVGTAVHSLRAVAPEDVKSAFALDKQAPAHMHVAEQKREVVDCIKYLHARPVSWLLDQVGLDKRFSLVHATHCEGEELDRLGRSGATVVICPSTEGDLGDGLFGVARFRAANGGGIAIGTDSHIGLDPLEELRWLDYGQRLTTLKRNVLCKPGEDSGEVAMREATRAGRRSMGLGEDPFAVGTPFDVAVLDPEHPLLIGKPASRRLAAMIYGGDAQLLKGVMRRGAWIVKDGRHERYEAIRGAYREAMRGLGV